VVIAMDRAENNKTSPTHEGETLSREGEAPAEPLSLQAPSRGGEAPAEPLSLQARQEPRPPKTTKSRRDVRSEAVLEPGYRHGSPLRAAPPDPKAHRRAFAQLASVVVGLGAMTYCISISSHKMATPPDPAIAAQPSAASSAEAAEDESDDAVEADVPEDDEVVRAAPATALPLDRAAIAAAEAEVDAASRDRARAEHRAAALARRVSEAAGQAALDTARARKLAYLVRDPSTRITQASARGGFLRGEREKIENEVSTLRQLPRPKLASLLSKSPVARPAASDEYHFELQHNRITFINLEKLLQLTKEDAQVRIRMADRMPVIGNRVGPVGAFSLEYELVRAIPGSMEELLERKSIRFDLRAWELIPESSHRGEAYESTRNPLSEFARAVNRITPGRATVTLWVYPDSFMLYRRIRADLVERGFSVAARPLPAGMTIRGSPMGTQSAAQ
jgi:hypothetical protein